MCGIFGGFYCLIVNSLFALCSISFGNANLNSGCMDPYGSDLLHRDVGYNIVNIHY